MADTTESSTKALRKCIKGVKSNDHDQESRKFGKNTIQALEAHNPQSDLWTWDGYCKRLMLELQHDAYVIKAQHDAYVITSKNGCVTERNYSVNNNQRFSPGGRGPGRGPGGRNYGRGTGGRNYGRGTQEEVTEEETGEVEVNKEENPSLVQPVDEGVIWRIHESGRQPRWTTPRC